MINLSQMVLVLFFWAYATYQTLPWLSGVSQGICLGPILLHIYTAEFKHYLSHSSLHSHADDSQLLINFNSSDTAQFVQYVNADLESANKWSDDHGFLLSSNKCPVFLVDELFLSDQSVSICAERCIFLDDKPLMSSDILKILGVSFASPIDFSNHVKAIRKTVMIPLKTLYRLSSNYLYRIDLRNSSMHILQPKVHNLP